MFYKQNGKKFQFEESEYNEKDHKSMLKHYDGGDLETPWNGWDEYVKQCQRAKTRNMTDGTQVGI